MCVGSGSILRLSAAGPVAPGLSYIAAGLLKGLPVLKPYELFDVPACPATASVLRHGTVWRLAPPPVGLCPSALDLQWRQDRDGEGKTVVSHLPLRSPCPAVWSFGSVPGMDAGGIIADCPLQRGGRHTAASLCSGILSPRLSALPILEASY